MNAPSPLENNRLDMTPEEVALLSGPDRRQRVVDLIALAGELIAHAEATYASEHKITGRVVLFSGGTDSTVLAHMMRDTATHAAHANTTIGIEQTRQFVRDTCELWGLPLIERTAPVDYRTLVLDQGFPGPGMHWKMYQRLKERGLRMVRRELVKNPRAERVIFLAGRRRHESARRANIPEMQREGSIIWVSPLVLWTALDMNTYREMYDVPRNEVSDLIHMSGECLCGAFAHDGEREEIRAWFPEVVEEIESLERELRCAGKVPEERCRWGWAGDSNEPPSQVGMLCSSCDARWQQPPLDGVL